MHKNDQQYIVHHKSACEEINIDKTLLHMIPDLDQHNTQSNLYCPYHLPFFHDKLSTTFSVILLTGRPMNKQANRGKKVVVTLKKTHDGLQTAINGLPFNRHHHHRQHHLQLLKKWHNQLNTCQEGIITLSVHWTCWRPVTHAQTWASHRAVYQLCSLSAKNI